MGEEHLNTEPRGFRDLYWCWNLNEPEIFIYTGENADQYSCPNCGPDPYEGQHTFIEHILKPRTP
jgi:hypothetical protein